MQNIYLTFSKNSKNRIQKTGCSWEIIPMSFLLKFQMRIANHFLLILIITSSHFLSSLAWIFLSALLIALTSACTDSL